MGTLHYIAFVFFIMFIVTAVIGQVTAWTETRSLDKEHHIIEEARGRPSNAYLCIASLLFVLALVIEVLALVIYMMQWVGWL